MSLVILTDYFSKADVEQIVLGTEVEILCLNTEDENSFPPLICEADALLVWHARLTQVTFEKMNKCRLIARYGVGYDNVQIWEARKVGIPVSNVPDYGTHEVADTTLSFLLSSRRGLDEYLSRNYKHPLGWDYRVISRLKRISGSTLGLIGLGRIGSVVAKRALVFGLRVLYYDPYVEQPSSGLIEVQRVSSLEEILNQSDHVSVHVPLTSETTGMIDEYFFKQMKPDALLINTSRGKVLKNLDVLEKELRDCPLRMVALDVLPEEPPSLLHPLMQSYLRQEEWIKHRLFITPHSAFYSQEALNDMRVKAAQNVARALKGLKIENVVN